MDIPRFIPHHESHGLQISINSLIQRYTEAIFRIEGMGANSARMAFLSNFRPDIDSSMLSDKIYYVANRIDYDADGCPFQFHILENSLATLYELPEQPTIPTVNKLRNKLSDGFLISGVAAVRINTPNGIRIPIIQRDQSALIDAGKFTLPAGRVDKSIGNTAYEELLEELLIFGRKNNKLYLVIPFLENPDIPRKKILQITTLARLNYISTLLQQDTGIPIAEIGELITAEPIFIRLVVPQKSKTIHSIFYKSDGSISKEFHESGFYPLYDKEVNTYEMIRFFDLDLSDFDELIIKDGDGHNRNINLVSRTEIEQKNSLGDFVNSLKHAISVGVFDDPL